MATFGIETKMDLFVPHRVELFGEDLISDTTHPSKKEAKPRVFSEFTRIDPENNAEILAFARKWGTMGICREHGLPIAHGLIPGLAAFGVKRCWLRQIEIDGTAFFAEPLEFWRRAIGKARVLQRIGSDLSSDGGGSEPDWLFVEDGLVIQGSEPWKNPVLARRRLGQEVQHWLEIGRVHPAFFWSEHERRWMMRHSAPGGAQWKLFSWLGLRLAIEIAGGKGVICPYCQNTYFPERLPGPKQDHKCESPDCIKLYNRNQKRKRRNG
jgi:hypothetical protein